MADLLFFLAFIIYDADEKASLSIGTKMEDKMKGNGLKEELERECAKLDKMIKEALDENRPVMESEEILKQSRKVDVLLNKQQRNKDRGESR